MGGRRRIVPYDPVFQLYPEGCNDSHLNTVIEAIGKELGCSSAVADMNAEPETSSAVPEKILTLNPAYGRKYASIEEMMADWNAGKDFLIDTDGPYASLADFTGQTIKVHAHATEMRLFVYVY